MEVLKLMNSNPNWRDVLRADPYNITIKEDGGFILLKYSQIESDFNLPIVRECRGAIFVCENGVWRCVRRAFDKFGNYGEGYAADIDWATASVQEKVDGSLMSVWYYNGWHLSTNGTIDAFKAPLADFGISFGNYFMQCLNCTYEEFLETLCTDCCYTFEMVGPLNRVVIPYEKPMLYAIGQRNMKTMEETVYSGPLDEWCNIHLPHRYYLHSLNGVIDAASKMSKDEEGFVVCDANYNRIKVKSPEYLMAARLRNNGVITFERLVEIIMTEKVDDFIAYCPQYEEKLREVEALYIKLKLKLQKEDFCADKFLDLSRAEYAKVIKDFTFKHYLFGVYDGKWGVTEYLSSLRPNQVVKMIEALKH